jgi:hypothetical protein
MYIVLILNGLFVLYRSIDKGIQEIKFTNITLDGDLNSACMSLPVMTLGFDKRVRVNIQSPLSELG